MLILLRGKYVKPLIELLELGCVSLTIDLKESQLGGWWHTPSQIIKSINVNKQIVITKKEYQKLLALIPIVDSPIDAFVMIYGGYLNDDTYDIDR